MNDIICFEQKVNPVEVFTSEKVDDLLNKIKERAYSFERDISTDKGRKAIASFAREIASTKVALDNAGKELVSGWKNQAAIVDAERKKIRYTLDELKEDIRKPLTDWENAEKERVASLEQRVLEISTIWVFPQPNPSMIEIEEAIAKLKNLSVFNWQEFSDRAKKSYDTSKEKLLEIKDLRSKYDAEQAELDRLRQEQIKREQKERDERIAAEAAAKAKAEADAAAVEAARIAKEKADKERKEAEQRAENERKAKEDAERRAKEMELAKIEADKKAEIEKKEAAEAAAKAERERIQAEEKAKMEELAKREKDKAHKAKIHNEALKAIQSIINAGGEDMAKTIVVSIAKGNIPNVKMCY